MELRSACLPLLRANPPASDITASDAVHLLALEIITDGGHAVASSWPFHAKAASGRLGYTAMRATGAARMSG
jgi:hypothetical protein